MRAQADAVRPYPGEGVTDPWLLSPEDVCRRLESDLVRGLSPAEADARLARTGPNELDEEAQDKPIVSFLKQFANTMIVVLMIAAGITILLGDVTDAIVIMAIVLLNAAIGFVQEQRAERAMQALKDMTSPTARVKRSGTVAVIPAARLVPGDIVILEAGDIVPADARLIEAPDIRVNEAPLTGESVPVDKINRTLDRAPDGTPDNMVYKGTSITYGRGVAIVTATGMRTSLGRVAQLMQSHGRVPTPLQKRLAALGRKLAAASLVLCAVIFAVGVLRGESVSVMFLTAVSLAVAAIPEALPAVVTVSLALGAQRMVRRHVIIRKLPAVETLGSVTVICTDKTGTLTRGRMQARKVWTPTTNYEVTGSGYSPDGDIVPVDDQTSTKDAQTDLSLLLSVARSCNDAELLAPEHEGGEWDIVGDPTEGALLALAVKGGHTDPAPRVAEVPFDSGRKMMTTVHASGDGYEIAVKGAPESLLPRTRDPAVAGRALEAADGLARHGYRVLALAGARRETLPKDVATIETDLDLFGLVALADAPRPRAKDALDACRTAGITPVVITGDHPETAAAITAELGVDPGDMVTGAELAEMGPDVHADRVGDIRIYARTSPEQKLDIVKAWKQRNEVVAMTGDGVNDAPALKHADIGVAMGVTGTEVSKEAADMVLTDDNFASIVAAVEEGRRIYDNIRRFVRYTLTSNSGEIWVMFLAPFFGLPIPLLPVHILWINLVTDGFPGLALGFEPAEKDVLRRPPRSPGESIFAHGLWQHVIWVGLLMGSVPLALGLWGYHTNRPWRTMVFTSLALLQLGHSMAVRSERESLFSLRLLTNRFLLVAVFSTLLLQLAVTYWGPLRTLLHTTPLDGFELLIVLLSSTIVFWAVEVEKLIRRRGARRA